MDSQWYYEQRYHREVARIEAGASENKKTSTKVTSGSSGQVLTSNGWSRAPSPTKGDQLTGKGSKDFPSTKRTNTSPREPLKQQRPSTKKNLKPARSSKETEMVVKATPLIEKSVKLGRDNEESERNMKAEKLGVMIAPDNVPLATRPTNEATLKLVAAVYFLGWQQTALQAYTRSINDLYVKPLVEQVTGNKLKSDGTFDFSKTEREQLKAGTEEEEPSDHQALKLRLQEATNRNWDNDGLHANVGEQKATLVEMAVLHRMRLLVQMCGSLLEIEAKLNKWLTKNISTLIGSASSLSLLPYTTYALEATSTLSEVFQLSIIDREKCKPEFVHLLRKTAKVGDYHSNQRLKIDKENPKTYIGKVEAQCNCFRACVYVIGSCLVATIHSLLRVIPAERIDVRPREVETVLTLLPSPFRNPPSLRLSAYSADLLKDAPPSAWQFSQPPQGKPMNPDHRADPDTFSEASAAEDDSDLEGDVEPARSAKTEEKSQRKEIPTQNTEESDKNKAGKAK